MLTDRQKRFLGAYSGPGSGLAAARAAGYGGSDAALKVAASRLIRHPAVAAELDRRGAALAAAPTKTEAHTEIVGPAIDATLSGPRVASPREIAERLTDMIRDVSETPRTRIDAARLLAQMHDRASARAGRSAAPAAPARPAFTLVLDEGHGDAGAATGEE